MRTFLVHTVAHTILPHINPIKNQFYLPKPYLKSSFKKYLLVRRPLYIIKVWWIARALVKNGLGKCLCWRNIWISIFLLFHKKPVTTFQPWPWWISLPDYQLIGHWNRTFDWKIDFCAGYEGQNKSEVNLARLGKKHFWCEIFKSLPHSKNF